ncbi:MAG: DsbA family protein [Solirubrobacteraceae bacterium]
MPDRAFYFDLASPEAYLAAERALRVLPQPWEWQPVLARRLESAETFEGFRCAEEERIFRAEFERRAHEQGVQAVRWPAPFPFDSELAMLAAVYAKRIGRCVSFAQAAFRQAFAAGHALDDSDTVLLAAAACEMHPAAVLKAVGSRGVREELDRASSEAAAAGVSDVPAVREGARVLIGAGSLEGALAR